MLCVLCAFAAIPSVARADGGGEAGLVIQHDDGTVETYCVAFTGDSISGDELLRRANIQVTQFGGLVCALGPQARGEGCFQPSSVESCLCKSYPPDSTYWAFFSEPYGKSWVYSAVGYTQAKARDGDMQAWKWGKGGPSSAPAPVAISFEQVCGHAPRGGNAPPPALAPTATGTATPTVPPTAVANSPAASIPAAVSPIAPVASATTSAATAAGSSPATGSQAPATVTPVESVTIISHGTSTATPVAAAVNAKDGGSNRASVLAFAAVVLALAGGIVAAWIWRRRHGS